MSPDVLPPRRWLGHPLWLVGFRPFFLLACAAGTVLPLAWALQLAGWLAPPVGLSPLQWHAHEMFYGLGLAVLGGFLLTATKNWVQVRGHFGHTLQALAAAWLFERAAMWWGGSWPAPVQLVAQYGFTVALVALLSWTLLRHRATDTYRDNALFLVALPLLLGARALLLSPTHYAQGRDITLALFRLAFLVMLERTMPPFMKAAHQVVLPRRAWVDWPIKGLGLALVAAPLGPPPLARVLALLLAAFVIGRLLTWSPWLGLRRLEVGVMYLGSLALAANAALLALDAAWVGALVVHVFTFGVMGLVIPAMLLRIAKGHTGRPVGFTWVDRVPLWVMGAGFLARVVAPQLLPALYGTWVWVAAGAWSLTFAWVGVRIAPMLLAERVDGREH